MTFIVDANIVFSAILYTDGKIGDLLINSKEYFTFLAPEFLRIEIQKHQLKLIKASGLTAEQVQEAQFQVYKNISFISEIQIDILSWREAEAHVSGVDPKDAPYIAYALHFKSKLWSGDKALIHGLEIKGFTDFISTEELFILREEERKKNLMF